MYLTYIEWVNKGGAVIDEPAFNHLEYQARRSVDRYTFDKLVNASVISECVKMAMFQVVDILQNEKQGQSVRSVSNDGVNVTFTEEKSSDEKIEQIILEYLTPDLLYCGV